MVQTLLLVTFGYSLKSEAGYYETIEEMKETGAFQKLLEWYNNCIVAGGAYFEGD